MGFIGLCLLVGLSGATITTSALHAWYPHLKAPPLTPPIWVFPLVWTGFYIAIGVAGWMVWQRNGASHPLRLWGWQLAANALWVPCFFGLRSPPLALVDLLLMLGLVVMTIRAFRRVRRVAAWLMVPYLLWGVFAFYLNAGFTVLNPV
ncbi:MAG TPA: TspO/MBR family protein [Rhodopila sp.]|uniref:TspO/MBR family protein n=1 Tax=Rhodopila sp. TaxID=2480087 RepID=UPI002B65AF2B|nr:TspO/MBR family protein [Rhodopila sp.]HVY16575.1 TspO/MBR family protein [Rhodopila sp.]